MGRLDDDELIPEPGILLFRKPGTLLCRNMGILLCRNPVYLMEAAVQTHKVLVERNDPAPGRVAPDACGGSAGAMHLFRTGDRLML